MRFVFFQPKNFLVEGPAVESSTKANRNIVLGSIFGAPRFFVLLALAFGLGCLPVAAFGAAFFGSACTGALCGSTCEPFEPLSFTGHLFNLAVGLFAGDVAEPCPAEGSDPALASAA